MYPFPIVHATYLNGFVLDIPLANSDTYPMEILFAVVAGLSIGSFLNVLIDRLPRGEDIVIKPSHCDYCKKPLRWFELVPLLSFLVQGGRCRRCRKRLSWQYPLIEGLTAIGFSAIVLLGFESIPELILRCIVVSSGIVIFMIDWKHQLIPDVMLGIMLLSTIGLGIPLSWSDRLTHLISGAVCSAFFFALWFGTRGRGIGFGDVKLGFVMGVMLGYPGTIIACYIAFLTGAFWGVILMITHKAGLKSRIAFGPFLILGIVVTYVFGTTIWAWWLSMV